MGDTTSEKPESRQPAASRANEDMAREGVLPAKPLPLPPGSLNLPVLMGHRRGQEDDKALLPRILSNEIAFRSELLARVQTAETALLKAIDEGLYAIDKASLPALANALAKLVTVSERIVERTKGLELPKPGEQVSGLYAKYAVLQKALEERGLVGPDGKLRNRPQRIAAIEVDVRVAGASSAGEQGGIGTGSLSDGGTCEATSPPPPTDPSGSPLESLGDQGVITEPLQAVPEGELPLGPPSALDGPRRNQGYQKNPRKARWRLRKIPT